MDGQGSRRHKPTVKSWLRYGTRAIKQASARVTHIRHAYSPFNGLFLNFMIQLTKTVFYR
jgi:hypothetical protein